MFIINDIPINIVQKPNGEQDIEITDDIINTIKNSERNNLVWYYKDDNDFFTLHWLCCYICDLNYVNKLTVHIMCLPYSKCNSNTLKYIAYYLDDLYVDYVVYDSSKIKQYLPKVYHSSIINEQINNIIYEYGKNNLHLHFPTKEMYNDYSSTVITDDDNMKFSVEILPETSKHIIYVVDYCPELNEININQPYSIVCSHLEKYIVENKPPKFLKSIFFCKTLDWNYNIPKSKYYVNVEDNLSLN